MEWTASEDDEADEGGGWEGMLRHFGHLQEAGHQRCCRPHAHVKFSLHLGIPLSGLSSASYETRKPS